MKRPPTRVGVLAPAKVNLRLDVLGRRADGYHEVDTLLACLGLADHLSLEFVPGPERVELEVRGPTAEGVPTGASNLVVRAAEAVLSLAAPRSTVPGTLRIALEKFIPVGAGLGGGSSDAAAAALGVAALLGLEPQGPAILDALGQLGSDCPFFLAARETGLGRGRGRGERVTVVHAELPAFGVLVLTPQLFVPTSGVYAELARGPAPTARAPWPAVWPGSRSAFLALLGNHLEAPARALHPELRAWGGLLAEKGEGHFHLSGSGSSFFGLFPDVPSAEAAGRELEREGIARDLGLRARWAGSFEGAGTRLK